MRLLSSPIFLAAATALVAACEPNLGPLSAQFGVGGQSSSVGGRGFETGGMALGGSSGDGFGGASAEAGGGAGAGGPATTDSCTDSERGPDESDVDCGGESECPRCEVGADCTRHDDCSTELCVKGRCAEPSCDDGYQNQTETDVDCGGNCAPESLCELGQSCTRHADCETSYCEDGACADHCSNNRRDGDETDLNCGGKTCEPCGIDKNCVVLGDCESGVCKNNRCSPATCNDDVKNQDETDVDCGGICWETFPCGTGDRCLEPKDCGSYICTDERCVADITISPTNVIDDLEDNNLRLPETAGRIGDWFRFFDETPEGLAELTPTVLSPKRASSISGLRFKTVGFLEWGSGFGFDFNNPGKVNETKLPYSAASTRGITFWARSDEAVIAHFQLKDSRTHPSGGSCTSCIYSWSKSVQLTPEWKRHTIQFSEFTLSQSGTPNPEEPAPTSLDSGGLVLAQWFFSARTEAEVWIDDVSLVK